MTFFEQQHLVRRVLDCNDQDAATTLYYYLLPRVVSALWRFDHSNLEDYVQLAMVQIFSKLATWRGDSSLSTWAYRVARNVVLQEVRKTKPIEVSTNDFEPSYYEPRFETMDRFKLRTKISVLTPKQRRLMELRLEGYTHAEISGKLHITIGSVKANLFKTTRVLRKAMLV
jgi:RNA polymerase sigma-70 factor (ECF subfamily)